MAMRTFRNFVLLLLFVAAAMGFYAWWQRTALAEQWLRAELGKRGIPVAALSVTGVGADRIDLGELALGDGGAVRAKSAALHFAYDWRGGRLGAFDATLQGVELRAQVQGGQLLLGGIEKAWSSALVTPDATAIALALDGDVKIARDAQGAFQANLQQGKLTLVQSQKAMLLPLAVDATANGDLTRVKARGTFHDARNSVQGSFAADYVFNAKTGTITWETQPMQFSPNGFTFAQLSPGFAEGIVTVAGTLSVSGRVDLKPGQWMVEPTVTILDLPVGALLASALGEGTVVDGRVKGAVPIRIMPGGQWRIEKSRLVNIGPMAVRLNPKTSTAALDNHPQGALVKSALSNLQVKTLTVDIGSTDDRGGVRLDWHFIGRNPDLLGGKPVDLTLAVTANLRDMWRSMQEVERATSAAERRLRKP